MKKSITSFLALLVSLAFLAPVESWAQPFPAVHYSGFYQSIANFGAKSDGVTDDTAALNAAILACYNAGGGVILIPVSVTLITGQIVFPNDNGAWYGGSLPASPYSRQPKITICGYGDVRMGQRVGPSPASTPPMGNSVLKLTYNAASSGSDPTTTYHAKLVTYGLGSLEIENLTLWDPTTSNVSPFVYTTGTTLLIHDNTFFGWGSGTSNTQDCIVLGCGSSPSSVFTTINDPAAPFQGYDTKIINNNFNHLRRCVYGRAFLAHVTISENYFDSFCGSNLSNGACLEFNETNLGGGGNDITNNRFEWGGYPYLVKCISSPGNYITGNDIEDPNGNYNLGFAYLDSASNGNYIVMGTCLGYNSGSPTPITAPVNDLTGGENTVINNTAYSPGLPQVMNLWNKYTVGGLIVSPRNLFNYRSLANLAGVYTTQTPNPNGTWVVIDTVPSSGSSQGARLVLADDGVPNWRFVTGDLSRVHTTLYIDGAGGTNELSLDQSGNCTVSGFGNFNGPVTSSSVFASKTTNSAVLQGGTSGVSFSVRPPAQGVPQFSLVNANASYPAWGVSFGALGTLGAATITDSSSSGTVPTTAFWVVQRPTLAASAPSTYTDVATFYITNSAALGGNVTITNNWGLWNKAMTRLDDTLLVNAQFKVQNASNPSLNLYEGATQSARIDTTSGNVSVAASGAGDVKIVTGGSTVMGTFGHTGNTLTIGGNMTALGYITSSDGRLKNVQGNFSRGLGAVLGLNPKQWRWNDKSKATDKTSLNTGFIAQDVQQHVPEAVGCDSDGYLTLNTLPIIAALVNSTRALAYALLTTWLALAYLLVRSCFRR